ncbi:unnamed protein product [Lactuca virosa]|uniref:Uncharacterized protein n=1 Tax=Lactuca virosa TaxID=75947 RepID=A0AAU9P9Y7_9ASTR|nr:unnamed protein product [Lactuca virosa]
MCICWISWKANNNQIPVVFSHFKNADDSRCRATSVSYQEGIMSMERKSKFIESDYEMLIDFYIYSQTLKVLWGLATDGLWDYIKRMRSTLLETNFRYMEMCRLHLKL